jgi:hypothetical protein
VQKDSRFSIVLLSYFIAPFYPMTLSKQLRVICLFALVSFNAYPQNTKIDVTLWLENEVIPLDDKSSIRLVSGIQTVLLPIQRGSVVIPDCLQKNGQKIIFNLNGTELTFDSIPLTWNRLLPKWIIKIDSPPFSDENKYLLRKAKESPAMIYLFDNNNGAVFTGYKYKKEDTTR